MTDLPGARPCTYLIVDNGRVEATDGGVVEEARLTIFVNVQEVATLMCSPLDPESLALGFLFNEGIIGSMGDVSLIRANASGGAVDVFLRHGHFDPPRRMVLTSGCGGGVTFQDLAAEHPALETPFTTTPDVLHRLMRAMKGAAQLYQRVRGVHTAILGDTSGEMLLSAEDVGRHNAIDRLAGKALRAGISTPDRIMVSSGRISSEMLNKARRLGVPVVASHTSPTSLTVQLAEAWRICVVGYVRQGSMRVYTHPQRLGLD